MSLTRSFLMKKYGADSLRWYLMSSSPPHLPKAFNEDELVEGQRKFFRALVESYRFFALYANVDGFEYKEPRIAVEERSELDKWIISCLNTLIKQVESAMDNYNPTEAARLIESFVVDNLSNWYIRRSRRRFWKGEMNQDKLAAYQTLYECLSTVCKLVSPITPFIAEEIYRNLNTATQHEEFESVHLSFFPTVEETAIDKELELRMKKAQVISSLVRTMREKSNLKVRQPLRRILLPIADAKERRELEKVREIILDEVNVKTIEYVNDESGIVNKKAKPNFKTLGKKFGKEVNAVATLVREMSASQISTLEKNGEYTLDLSGKEIKIQLEDVEILREDIEGWLVASDSDLKLTIALDTELNDDLKNEGLVRELVNRIQSIRKDSGLEITDRIKLYLSLPARMRVAVEAYKDYLMNETLAVEINFELNGQTQVAKQDEINGEAFRIAIEKQ
jgi:isoleucyl-tRNA synthetase